MCFAPVPFGKGLVPIDLDIGVLFIFAVSGVTSIGVLMAGWGSGNKFSMLGGLRGAAQLVSYEIPRVLSVVPVLMMYSTQSLAGIALAQEGRWMGFLPKWFIFYPVIGQISFLIFLIASVAETNRTPFDIPEAESELVAGFHTEFSGLKFALFFLAEYAYVFLSAAMAVALFMGGDGFSAGGPAFLDLVLGEDFCDHFPFSLVPLDLPTTSRGPADAVLLAVHAALGVGQHRTDRIPDFMATLEQQIPLLIFGLFSVVLIALSLVVVTARSVFRSALALTAALAVVAGLFALLGADSVSRPANF